MLIPKYNKFIFYCHNFGNFDFVFVCKALAKFNSEYRVIHHKDYYSLNIVTRDDDIIKLTIRIINPYIIKKDNTSNYSKYINITFVDSYNLLTNSLDDLTKDFNTKTKKGIFPYNFVNRNNLSYIGPIPDISYYDLDKLDTEKKDIFIKNHEKFKSEKII